MSNDTTQALSSIGQDVKYAGFWARFAALLVDFAILTMIILAIGIASMLAGAAGIVVGQILIFAVYLLYWPAMESSSRQATFGKSILGIQVTDLDGARVSFLRSLLRNIAKIISAIPMYIGFLLAAFTKRKQALHDMITKCLVVRTGPSHFLRALAAGVGGLVIAVGSGVAFFYYVVVPQMQDQAATAMQQAMKTSPQAKSTPASPPVSKSPAPAPVPAAKPAGVERDFGALSGSELAGLEKPGTTRAGPAILALDQFFPSSIWVKVNLPLIKDLDLAPPPEVTVTSVLDQSGKQYYDSASPFEKGMFVRARLSRQSTPVPHFSGQRDVHVTSGLSAQTLQKIDGQVRITIPVDAKPVVFEAGDTGKEQSVHGVAVALKSLAGAKAVLHYRGASSNLLGARGYGKDGAQIQIESWQIPPRNQAVDMDLYFNFKGPVSKVEVIVAASLVEQEFPFSLVRGAVAAAPPAAVAAATKLSPSKPEAATATAAGPKPASAVAPAATIATRESAKPAPGAQTPATAKSADAAPPAPVAKIRSEPSARSPRRRIAQPAALKPAAATVAAAPAVEPKVISPRFNDVMTAVIYGDEDAVKQLLDLGRWVDKPSSLGFTPLMAAAMRRETRIAQLLLDHGADPNAGGPGGVTALALAREQNDNPTATLLLQRGAR